MNDAAASQQPENAAALDALADQLAACGAALPLPAGGREAVFSAPWQAHAFAITLQLHERGLFTWPQWAEALGAELRAAGPGDDGSRYYEHWLAALERLVVAQGAGSAADLHRLAHAWEDAAARTPHGQPIVLADGDG